MVRMMKLLVGLLFNRNLVKTSESSQLLLLLLPSTVRTHRGERRLKPNMSLLMRKAPQLTSSLFYKNTTVSLLKHHYNVLLSHKQSNLLHMQSGRQILDIHK